PCTIPASASASPLIARLRPTLSPRRSRIMPERPLPPGSTIGILGGGQLGRMLAVAASRLGLKSHIYSDETGAPAFDVAASNTVGSYADAAALARFAASVDVLTCEFENVPAATLEACSR